MINSKIFKPEKCVIPVVFVLHSIKSIACGSY
jgi:hypothetical protein